MGQCTLQLNFFNVTSLVNQKSVVIARCHIIVNMTLSAGMSYYWVFLKIHNNRCSKVAINNINEEEIAKKYLQANMVANKSLQEKES